MPALLPASIACWMRTAASETRTYAAGPSYRYSEFHFLFISIFPAWKSVRQCLRCQKSRPSPRQSSQDFRRRRGDIRRQRRRGCDKLPPQPTVVRHEPLLVAVLVRSPPGRDLSPSWWC